jgi:AcrR family transcriptional regulator
MKGHKPANAQGPRPRKPNRLRGTLAEQKQKSRARLIAAGRRLGVEGRFIPASVDDIARQAGLSRAAFYLHFKNKEELLQAVLTEQMEVYAQDFRTVSPRKIATRAGILDWFNQIISRFAATGELIGLYWSSAPMSEVNREFHHSRCASIEILGHRLPALRLFKQDGSIDPARQMEILLFVYQLEQLTYMIAFGRSHIDSKLALDRLAQHFVSLLNTASS